jgi:hypothetical protein
VVLQSAANPMAFVGVRPIKAIILSNARNGRGSGLEFARDRPADSYLANSADGCKGGVNFGCFLGGKVFEFLA